MMDNLQEAYTSYQQALYHLRDPKVSVSSLFDSHGLCVVLIATVFAGAEIVVWNWNSLRPLRISRPRRRSFLPGHANGARLRKGQRNLLPLGYNL